MIGRHMSPKEFLARVGEELGKIDPAQMKTLADWVWDVYQAGRFVYVIGNGGSGSNASHFCEDMGKGTIDKKDFDNDAKRRLKNLAGPGDLLVAISGSGNSPNILRAVEWANRHGLKTFGCTGFSGGKLRTAAQANLHVPLDDMGMVESI